MLTRPIYYLYLLLINIIEYVTASTRSRTIPQITPDNSIGGDQEIIAPT